MKKSVIFLIGVIYIISIVVVTFFGMKVNVDQFPVYMTNIEITNYSQIVNNRKYNIVQFDDTEGYVSFFVEYEVGPDNASYPEKINFSLLDNTYIDEEGKTQYYATITKNGELTFYARKAVIVVVSTNDGSKLSDSMNVICK